MLPLQVLWMIVADVFTMAFLLFKTQPYTYSMKMKST